MTEIIQIGDNGVFPGNRLPALLYNQALDIPLLFPATHVSKLFERNGWSNSWDAGILLFIITIASRMRCWAFIPGGQPFS